MAEIAKPNEPAGAAVPVPLDIQNTGILDINTGIV